MALYNQADNRLKGRSMSLAKKFSSTFLSVVLVAGLLPCSAYADPVSGNEADGSAAQNNEAARYDDDGIAAYPGDDDFAVDSGAADEGEGTEVVYWGDDSTNSDSGQEDMGQNSADEATDGQSAYSEGKLAIWAAGLDGTLAEEVYPTDANQVESYADDSGLTRMKFSEEMTYFCKYESSCNYDQGLSSGDGYHAMGYFQFDNRYGLGSFLKAVYNYNPSKYSALKQIGDIYNWDVYGNDGSTNYYKDGRSSSLREDLNRSWHQAYAADPTEFSELQNGWAYTEYYSGSLGAKGILGALGINLDNRPDCIKGLCWGMVNLFGAGGGASYINEGKYYGASWFFKNSGINDSMTNKEMVTILCDFVVNNVAERYSSQPQYHQGWQNRYKSEKADCLNYLAKSTYTIDAKPYHGDASAVTSGEYVIKSKLADRLVLQASGNESSSSSALSVHSSDMGWNQIFQFEKDSATGLTRIKDKDSGKYLSLNSSESRYSPNVAQREYSASDSSQLWVVEDAGSGTVAIYASVNSDYCLDVSGASTADGTAVKLYQNNGTDAQKWQLYSTSASVEGGKTVDDGIYTVSLKGSSDKVLDVDGGSTSNGANVQVWDSNGTAAQKFRFECGSDGFYTITNLKSGKVLDVSCGSVLPGTNVQQYSSNKTDAQKWAVYANSDGSYSLICKANGLALDVDGKTSGSNVRAWELTKADSQSFEFNSAETERVLADGTYLISSSLNRFRVLDVASGSSSNGARIQLYDSNMTAAQKFTFSYDEATGFYKIANAGSGKALDATDGKVDRGVKVQQWESNDTLAQRWQVEPSGDGIIIRSALDQSYVFDATNGSSSNGTGIQLWESNGSNAQKFYAINASTSVEGGKTIDDGIYTVSLKGSSDKVLDVDGGSTSNGANVQVWDSNGTAAQKFRFECDSDGFYAITNLKSGKVLDAADGNLVPGTNVQQYSSNKTDAQKWAVRVNSDGTYSIVCKANGLTLDASGSSKGSNVQLWTADDARVQSFNLSSAKAERTVEDGTYIVSSAIDRSKTLDVAGGSKANGARIQIYESNMTSAQSFRFVYDEITGYYAITNIGSGKVLDATDGKVSNGVKVQQWESNGTLAQRWEIVTDGEGYRIRSAVDPSKVFDVTSGNSSNSTGIQLWESNGTNAQKFYMVSSEHEDVAQCEDLGLNDWYEIVPTASSSVCLDVSSASKSDGAKIQLYNNNQTIAQLFKLQYSDGYYRIVSLNSNKAIELKNGSIVPGVKAEQTSLVESGAQQFRIDKNVDGSYTFTCAANALRLSATALSSGSLVTGESADNTSACETFKLVKRDYAIPEGLVEISTSLDDGKDVDVADASDTDGGNIQLYASNGTAAQKWQISHVSGKQNVYRFESANSGKYMAVSGTNVCQCSYNENSAGQMWMLVGIDAGSYSFMNLENNKVLDVESAGTANGTNIQTYSYNGTSAQKFNLKNTDCVKTGMYVFHSRANYGQVLDVSGGSSADGANVQSYAFNDSGAQKWSVVGNGDGTYRIVNAANGKVFDVANGNAYNGANVQQYSWNGSNAQRWYATYQGGGGMSFESAINRNLVLSLASSSPSNGTNLQLAKKDGSAAQRFLFEETSYTPPMPSDRQAMLDRIYWESSGTQWLIGVDRSQHRVGVFRGNSGNWSLQYWWSCVTGAPSTPTITGTYRTTGYKRDSLSTDSRAIYCTQIYGGYFFHSVLNSENELGQSLSHGCIRMAWSSASWIHDNIYAGTTVVIYN